MNSILRAGTRSYLHRYSPAPKIQKVELASGASHHNWHDYDIPLWNFWAAIQPLPNDGLWQDGFHLTFARNFFDDPVRMKNAWPWRNFTALQTLDIVRRGLMDGD